MQNDRQNLGTNQHFLPRFLLRAFGSGKKRHRVIYQFDKVTSVVTPVTAEEVGCESGFYDSAIYGCGIHGADGALAPLENAVAPLLRDLVKHRSLACLPPSGQHVLAEYIAKHLHRTPAAKGDADALGCLLERSLAELGATVQDMYAGLIKSDTHKDHVKLLCDMDWHIVGAAENDSFWLADNWILPGNPEHFMQRRDGTANCGLAMPGTELRLPLSPDISLWLFRESSGTGRALRADGIARTHKCTVLGSAWMHAFRVASLCRASRYIYAPRDNFDFARKFLAEHPQYREAPKNLMLEVVRRLVRARTSAN